MNGCPTAIAVAALVAALCPSLACSSPTGNCSATGGSGQVGAGGARAGTGGTTTGTSVDGGGLDAGAQPPSNRPNIIIVLTDDQGYGDVGCFGATSFVTPNLDRLASEGMQFMDFYSAANVCSPSRAALMTGSYPVRVGVTYVLDPGAGVGLNLKEVTIAELLKSVGYATAAIGKWHLGDDKTFLPTRQGFDQYFGLPYSNDMSPLPLLEGEQVIEQNPDLSQLTKRYTQKALDFITGNRDKPFFLYLAHTMPHVPLAASADFEGLSERGLFGDVIMEIDWSVGRILDTLDQLGIAGNTLVAFTSDNGPWLLYGNHGGSAGPLREGKMTTFDGGHRVPGIMRWPDRIKGKTVSKEITSSIDLFPTIADITGGSLPTWKIDGRSLLPILEGKPEAAVPREALYFYEGDELQAVRSGPWKLHLPHSYLTITKPGVDGAPGAEESRALELSLFNLDDDPGETVNLAEQHPDLVSRLSKDATAFDRDIKSNKRPIGTVGSNAQTGTLGPAKSARRR